MANPLNIGIEQAAQKIRQYCAYQERNHQEVKEKLFGYGLYKDQVETLMASLISENYLNEERYAIAFAGGKFKIKEWGKVKIKYALKQNKISEYCIKKALNQISEDDYLRTLEKLFHAKHKEVKKEKNIFVQKKKIQNYLMQKGFEHELIHTLLQQL